MKVFLCILGVIMVSLASVIPCAHAGTLYAGTDLAVFPWIQPKIAKITTDGPLITGRVIVNMPVDINGLGEGNGVLYGGAPTATCFTSWTMTSTS